MKTNCFFAATAMLLVAFHGGNAVFGQVLPPAGQVPAIAETPAAPYSEDSLYWPDRLYVKLKNTAGIELQSLQKVKNTRSLKPLHNIFSKYQADKLDRPFAGMRRAEMENTYRINFKNKTAPIKEIIDELKILPYVEYVERVPIARTFVLTPNDYNAQQYALPLIGAFGAFDWHQGGGATIAIVDNSVRTTHQDLQNNIVPGYDVANGDNNPNPPNANFFHGTHCAGIAGAVTNNGVGIASIGFNNKIMPVKCTPDNGAPNTLPYAWDGVTYAINHGATVISCSWGSPVYSITEQTIVDIAYAAGIVIIAAAGNDNSSAPQYPAAYNHVISVASTDANDFKSSFSNYGTWIDVCAPGSLIYSTVASSDAAYGTYSGTSMACPLVAGLAGLMKSYHPAMNPDQIEACLKNTATNINTKNPSYVNLLGTGRIDAAAAIQCLCNATITLSAITASPPGVVYAGNSVNFSVVATNAVTYEWKIQQSTTVLYSSISASPALSYTFTGPGSYRVCVTARNSSQGCDVNTCLDVAVMEQNDIAFIQRSADKICDILELRNGGFLVANVVSADPGKKIIQKLGKTGNIVWTYTTATIPLPPYFQTGIQIYNYFERGFFSISEDDNGAIVLAIPAYDNAQSKHYLTVLKLDAATGQLLWQKEFRVASTWQFAYPIFIKKDRTGGFIIAGSATAHKNFFLLKLDDNGNQSWVKFYNTNNSNEIKGFIQTSDNGYLLYGNSRFGTDLRYWFSVTKIRSDGSVYWNKDYLPVLNSGNYYLDEVSGFYDAVEMDGCQTMLIGRHHKVSASFLSIIDAEGNIVLSKVINNLTALGLSSPSYGKYQVAAAQYTAGAIFLLETDVACSVQKSYRILSSNSYYFNEDNRNIVEAEKIIPTQDNGLLFYSGSIFNGLNYECILAKANANGFTSCSDAPSVFQSSNQNYNSRTGSVALDNNPPTVNPANLSYPNPLSTTSPLQQVCSFASSCNMNVSFYVNRRVLFENEPIAINNTSTGATTLQWEIDGSLQSAPPAFFSGAGLHTIKLTGSNGSCTSSLVRNVMVIPNPNATFSATPVAPAGTFAFAAQQNYTFAKYAWNFGDGTSNTQPVVNHGFYDPGIFNVCLDVKICGIQASYCQNASYACPAIPTPVISDAAACSGLPVTLTVPPLGSYTANWFEDATSTNALASGLTYTTPPLSTGVYDYFVGYAEPAPVYSLGLTAPPTSYDYRVTNNTVSAMILRATSRFYLTSFKTELCNAGSSMPLTIVIKQIQGYAPVSVSTDVFTTSITGNTTNQIVTIPVNQEFPPGDYLIGSYGSATICKYVKANAFYYPYDLAVVPGVVQLVGHSYTNCCYLPNTQGEYPGFFDFKIKLHSDCKGAREDVIVTVITSSDSDGDGVCNALDKCPGAPDNIDADADGIPDGCDQCNNVNPLAFQLGKCFGGNLDDYAGTVLPTSDGGYLIAGSTMSSNNGDVPLNHGLLDAWVVKLNSNKVVLWKRCLGGSGLDGFGGQGYLNDILAIEDAGSYVLAGHAASYDGDVTGNNGQQDIWLLRLNTMGSTILKKCIGGASKDDCNSIQRVSAGGFILAGSTRSPKTNFHGNLDAWAVYVDANFNVVWEKCYGGNLDEMFSSVQEIPGTGFIFAGNTNTINNGDVTGQHGGTDYWVVKVGYNGVVQWTKCYGGNQNDYANCIRRMPDNSFIVSGYARSYNGDVSGNHGMEDYWVLRINQANGNVMWKNCYGGAGADFARNLFINPSGTQCTVVGTSNSTDNNVTCASLGTSDVWAAVIDPANGNLSCSKCHGGANLDDGWHVRQTLSGNLIIVGNTKSPSLSGYHGNSDAWLLEIK